MRATRPAGVQDRGRTAGETSAVVVMHQGTVVTVDSTSGRR
jgi:hypothetical protein